MRNQKLTGKEFLDGVNINDSRIYNKLTNSQMIFVGIKQNSNNKAVACVGNETQDPNTLRDAVRRDVNSSRLTSQKVNLENTYVYVTFLGNPSKWININKTDFMNCNFNECAGISGPIGVNVIFIDNSNAIFIPDVWKENPDWSAENILTKLIEKAGKSDVSKIKKI
jgi:AMMECR1 domain-containing protein